MEMLENERGDLKPKQFSSIVVRLCTYIPRLRTNENEANRCVTGLQ